LREFWTLASQQASYVFRVTDLTQDGGPLEAPTSEGRYSAGPTDGAVANFGWDSAYLPTFGGVIRYDISGSEPVPLEDSYQPAHSMATGLDYTTEHLELVDLGPAGSPAWHLITTTALGNFYAWPLDPLTHDPLPGEVHVPGAGYWPPWSGNTYGNDIAVATLAGKKWIYLDHSNKPSGELGIGRFNWTDMIPGSALIWEDLNPPGPILVPHVRDLTVEANKWLLAAAEGGFLIINLATWTVTDDVRTNNVDGLTFASVLGIEKYGNRIFASLSDPNNRFAFAMYAFDEATGKVIDPKTGLESEFPIAALYDGQFSMPDDFPGIFLDGGERISKIETELGLGQKKVRLYSGTGNGHLLEIEWQQATDTLTPLSYWHNGGYFDHIADCNVYKLPLATGGGAGLSFGPPVPQFTLRIVVAKTRETFEIVKPPDMP
jgi:hypothetical protein